MRNHLVKLYYISVWCSQRASLLGVPDFDATISRVSGGITSNFKWSPPLPPQEPDNSSNIMSFNSIHPTPINILEDFDCFGCAPDGYNPSKIYQVIQPSQFPKQHNFESLGKWRNERDLRMLSIEEKDYLGATIFVCCEDSRQQRKNKIEIV